MDDLGHLEDMFMELLTQVDNIKMNKVELEDYDEYVETYDEDDLSDYYNLTHKTKPKIKRIAVAIDATQQFFIEDHLQKFIEQLPDASEYHVITFDTCILQMSVEKDKNDIMKLTNNMLIGSGPCLSVVKDFIEHNQYDKIYVFSDGYFSDDCDTSKMIFYSPDQNLIGDVNKIKINRNFHYLLNP